VVPVLLVDQIDRISVVTLNRPEARNALNAELMAQLPATLRHLDESPEVDVIVLTGTDPTFCAGLDLRELEAGVLRVGALTRQGTPWPDVAKPVIGAVNGPAITGGLELALWCDFLVASENARFADAHARLGIQPFWGLTWALPAAVGLRNAKMMSATGNPVTASRALAMGLVIEVTPHEQLLSRTLEIAADVASNDGPALRQVLATETDNVGRSKDEAYVVEYARAQEWHANDIDGGRVAERRAAVTARGRSRMGGS
jgi:enoyl-CoA hydratase